MSLGDHAPIVTRHYPAGGSTMGCICGWEVPDGPIDHEVAYAAHVDGDCDSATAIELAVRRIAQTLDALPDKQRKLVQGLIASWP